MWTSSCAAVRRRVAAIADDCFQAKKGRVLWPVYIPQKSGRAEAVPVRSAEDGLLEECLGLQLFDRDHRGTRLDSFHSRFQIGRQGSPEGKDEMHSTHDLAAPTAPAITFDVFLAVDIRVGTIVAAEPFPEARKPAFRLVIDFGETIGRKKTSAQITENYSPDALLGRQVAAVVNFPPRQIGKFMSEVLTLGFADATGAVVLFKPDQPVPDGSRLF
jgi:tRNA-binding protein